MAMKLSPALETEKGHGVGLGSTLGWPWDPSEWTPELTWPLSVRIFGQMRRQDAQVAGVLRSITLPIRRTRWRVDPNGARPEVVSHVSADLNLARIDDDSPEPSGSRTRGRFRWDEHLRMALLALPYGHMFFEQVYEIRDDGLAHLAKLAPRLPETIAKIDVDRAGELLGIEQYPSGMVGDTGPLVRIEAGRLVPYSIDREGGSWQGQSVLRAAYKHWMLKDRLLRVDAMTKERNGMGVPIVTSAEGATQAQIDNDAKMAQAYRAGEASGGSLAHGAEMKLVGVSGTLPDIIASIRYHDEQVAMMVLAQFLELGHTAHGSRALGASFIDFFILALQAIADEIAMTATAEIVEDLVDINYGENEPSPRIVVAEIGEEHELTAQSIMQLVEAGALTNDEGLENYIRGVYRLPALDGPARPGYGTNEPATGGGTSGTPAAASRGKVAAGSTPATVKNWPGWRLDRRLVNHYGPAIARAFAGALDAKAAVRAYRDVGVVRAAAEPHELDLAKAQLSAASWDLAPAADELASLYGAAYVAGARAGRLSIGGVPAAAWEADIDWSRWTPGDLEAAAKLVENPGLRSMLADASVTIRSIADNRLDDLARTLADGVANGDSVNSIASSLTGILSDPDRADMVANTEVARAMTTASLDTYAANGVDGKEFVTFEPCDECQENEDEGVIGIDEEFANGDPPVHPSCRCALVPAYLDTGEAPTAEGAGNGGDATG